MNKIYTPEAYLILTRCLLVKMRHHRIPHYDSRTKVKVLLHNFQQLLLTPLGGPKVEDGDGEWMGNANSIGYL